MIHARGLRRTFTGRRGTVEAVRGVDLDVAAGEIVAFLGPNGAGKTTTQRMLATLLDATAGEATVAGCDLRRDPRGVRRRIGYVAQSGSTNALATVDEDLMVQGQLFGLPAAEVAQRAAQLRSELDLADLGGRLCKTLSGGQRRRVDIALGLIHRPALVFLDEPSTGLDPQSRANLWQHIRRLRDDRGTTVFLTTHYLDEADALADRILVIDRGLIVAVGTPAELKRRVSRERVRLELADADAATQAATALTGATDVHAVRADGAAVDVEVDDAGRAMLPLAARLAGLGLPVARVQLTQPTLDDVFLTLTGRSLRDEEAA